MSSTTPPPPAGPDGADPSMEEILASIRRILNDDDAPATPEAVAEKPEPAAEEDDVLILDDTMMVAAPEIPHAAAQAEPAIDTPEPVSFHPDIDHDPRVPDNEALEPFTGEPALTPPEAAPPRPAVEAETSVSQPDFMAHSAPMLELVGPAAAAAAASSVGNLVRTLAAGRATQVYAGGPTLEDMVRAELRPLLKNWLDMHLAPMVERLVRAEIERVVGRFVP